MGLTHLQCGNISPSQRQKSLDVKVCSLSVVFFLNSMPFFLTNTPFHFCESYFCYSLSVGVRALRPIVPRVVLLHVFNICLDFLIFLIVDLLNLVSFK